MKIQINQQFAQLGLKTTNAYLARQTTLPALELKTRPPEVKLRAARLNLYIDQSQCFADINRRGLLEFGLHCREIARADTAAGIDRIVAEGNQMAAFEQGNTVEQIAENAFDTQADFNLAFLPEHRPYIEWQQQPFDLQYNPGQVETNYKKAQIQTKYHPGQVEIYLLQKNHLEINWLGNNIDKTG